MSKKPFISIVIPTYNAENLLVRTLDSIIQKEYENKEIVVIDGRSSDKTIEILQRYDSFISFWTSEPDKGTYDAMNKGIKHAKGDFLLFMGAGDLLVVELSELASYLQHQNCIYYGDVYFKQFHRIYDGPFDKRKIITENICHQAIFYPKSVFEKYEYNLRYPVLADYDLNIKCFGDTDFKFEYLPLLISMFIEGGLSSKISDDRFLSDFDDIVISNLSFFTYIWSLKESRQFKQLFRFLKDQISKRARGYFSPY